MAPNDNHFPSSKPPSKATTVPPPPIPNGSKTTTNSKPTPIPPRQPPIRQQLYSDNQLNQQQQQQRRRRWQRPSNRRICCCCCFWSILILLITILVASLLAIGLYVVYQPRPPSFTVASLRIHRFNLTASADSSAAHLSSLFNLTLVTKNPNSQFVFTYDPFLVSVVTDPDEILLGNGAIPRFSSGEKNLTSFRGVAVASTEARELDFGDGLGLKSDLKRRSGGVLDLKVVMDTKVEIKMGKLRSKRVGIRVSCGGIRGSLPKGKAVTMASTDKSKCEVDLRIKIWNWTF